MHLAKEPRKPLAVDVLISGFTGAPRKEHLKGSILRLTKMSPERAAEIAGMVSAGQKVIF